MIFQYSWEGGLERTPEAYGPISTLMTAGKMNLLGAQFGIIYLHMMNIGLFVAMLLGTVKQLVFH